MSLVSPGPLTAGDLSRARIVPIVTIEHAEDAAYVVAALVAGGLSVIEITLRTAAGI